MSTIEAPVNTRQSVYHTLGEDVSALTDRQEMLAAAGADFTLIPGTPVAHFPVDSDGSFVSAPVDGVEYDQVTVDLPTVSVHRSDTLEALGTFKPGYHIFQPTEVLDLAVDLATALGGDAKVEHIAAPDNGALMLASVSYGDIILDPNGIADVIGRKVDVWSSANGKLPIMAVPTMLRFFCLNQLPVFRQKARSEGMIVKHTKGAPDRLALAVQAAEAARAANDMFVEQANSLIARGANHDTLTRVINKVWELAPDASDNAKTRHAGLSAAMHAAFDAPTNAPAVGENLWAVYQTVTEYLDHGRGTNPEKRAFASLVPGGWVDEKKRLAHQILLGMVN